MLPTISEITTWSNEKLLLVINSGESINWDCGIDESQSEIDNYVEVLYIEVSNRGLVIN